jgi:hypothetical protein
MTLMPQKVFGRMTRAPLLDDHQSIRNDLRGRANCWRAWPRHLDVHRGVFGSARAEETAQGSAIRLFRIDVPDEALIDLRRRLASLVLLRRRVTSNM